MKRLHTISILVLSAAAILVAGIGFSSAAQAKGLLGTFDKSEAVQEFRAMTPDERLAKMTEKLDLTGEQQAQIRQTQTDLRHQIGKLLLDDALAQADRREQIRQAVQDAKARVLGLLTPEQKAKIEAAKTTIRERVQQRVHRRFATLFGF